MAMSIDVSAAVRSPRPQGVPVIFGLLWNSLCCCDTILHACHACNADEQPQHI